MRVCEECKGTGTVTLLTTSGPCKTCTAEKADSSLDEQWWAKHHRAGTVGRDKIGRGWKVKKTWHVACDSRERKPSIFTGWPEPFPLRMIDFEKAVHERETRRQVGAWNVFVQEYNAAVSAEAIRAAIQRYCEQG